MNALEKLAAKQKLATRLTEKAKGLLRKLHGKETHNPAMPTERVNPRVNELLKRIDAPVGPETLQATEQLTPKAKQLLEKISARQKLDGLLGRRVKTAGLGQLATPLVGGGLGYLKGVDADRGGEGAVRGAIGAYGGGALGSLGGLAVGGAGTVAAKKALGKHLAGLPPHAQRQRLALLLAAPALLGGMAGSIGGYKALTDGVDKKKKK